MKRIRLKNPISLIILLAFATVLFNGCEKQKAEPSKSMEQIREEEGVPVKTLTLEKKPFEKYLKFFAKISGIKESTKHSSVSDKVLKVNAKVGSRVGEGKVIIQFPTDNPALQYTQAKTALENSEKTYNRMQELLKAGETSQQNFDNVETQYLVSKRNFEAIKQMLFVEAPISGTIVELNVQQGDDVRPGDALFTVAQTQVMKGTVWASEEETARLKLGMPATMNYNGKEYTGKVSEIALAMDAKKRAFKVEIQFRNNKNELKSGITTEVNIKTYSNPETIIIARNYIKKEGDKEFVYVVKNGAAEKRFIETGYEDGINVEVTGGLNPGDQLISKGQSLVDNGTKVKVIQ